MILVAAAACSKADNISNSKSMKMKIVKPWDDITVKLVRGGSGSLRASKSETQQIKVKRAVYDIAPRPLEGRSVYSMLLIPDPFTRKQIFIDGEHTFYISDSAGMKGFTVCPGGDLLWSGSYLELSDTNQSDTAIAQFERSFDSQKLKQEWAKRLTVNRMVLRQAVSQFYFSAGPYPGGAIIEPQIETIDLTDGILRLDIRNPVTKIAASIWIDLKAKTVVKSVVDGQEMDVSAVGTSKAYAVPSKKK